MPQQPEVVFDVARGDLGAARHLRRSLEVLAASATDPQLRRHLTEVLAGRASMREFGRSETFARLLDGIAQDMFHRAGAMPAAERERLAALGRAELDQLRETDEPATAPTTGVPGSHAPDPDDSYFEGHRHLGWLE
ncbi:hypothetical protein F5X71_25260 [Nocardia brasiliensis]|uniref:Uncharacterized protein n=1 Tax=Nocardia brasiliensis TaxID=37326 RepID=A0A6G9XWE8_NOCBR|nr:hypothetical protein [Nocardia brasiliensis]QIS05180.1 hypothetical protein F5X71_25260 [Nocardia brasiliensis]